MKIKNPKFGGAFYCLLATCALGLGWPGNINAQSNPTPHILAGSDYTFNGFANGTIDTWPASMMGWNGPIPSVAPEAEVPVNVQATDDGALWKRAEAASADLVFRNDSAHGLSFKGTEGDDDPLAVVVALDTRYCDSILVSWTNDWRNAWLGTISGIQCQYRIGESGNWTNLGDPYRMVEGVEEDPSEYDELLLDDSLEGKEVVQIRWMAFNEQDGLALEYTNRLTVDDILIRAFYKNGPKPLPDFSWSPESPRALEEVTFNDLSTNTPADWFWRFGDGNTSTEVTPTHTYSIQGVYEVALIVSNVYGTDSIKHTLTIGPELVAPQADFSFSRIARTVDFLDASVNDPATWEWDFGDMLGSATVQNPSYTYLSDGTYEVRLIVSNAAGSDTSYETVVVAQAAPVAQFSFDKDLALVEFTDASTNNPTAWEWDFGDGVNTYEQHPEHTFADNGNYTVCLTASNVEGEDTYCATVNINVGVYDQGLEGVGIYPNPVKEHLMISGLNKSTEMVHLRIRDLSGRMVHEGTFAPSALHILPLDLERGIYQIELSQGNKGIIKNLIKE